ncbi:MAG: hypothetical protein DI543_05610, partial [Bradyrhizobium icense]
SMRIGRDARRVLEARRVLRDRIGRRLQDVREFVADDDASPLLVGRALARGREALGHDDDGSHHLAVRGTIDVAEGSAPPRDIDGNPVLADPRVDTYLTCFNDNPVGTVADVAARLGIAALHAGGLTGEGVAIAIVDTGINLDFLEAKLGYRPKLDTQYSWRPPGVNVQPGDYPVGHGTMCAYAALLAAPKATLIDVPAFIGEPPGGAAIGRRLSVAYQGIAQLSAFWSIAFTASGAPKYKSLVINNSWGMFHSSWDFPAGHPGRYADNPKHVFTRSVAAMSSIDHVDMVFAAGNCGTECPDEKCQHVTAATITGANALSDVLTVAGCDLSGERVGYSSQGPGIVGMASSKPDLAAYTHFLGSQALGTGKPDKGTSTAGPLVAGCIAALRTKLDPGTTSPARLNEQLRQSARRAADSAWNADLGNGIIDPVVAADALGLLANS